MPRRWQTGRIQIHRASVDPEPTGFSGLRGVRFRQRHAHIRHGEMLRQVFAVGRYQARDSFPAVDQLLQNHARNLVDNAEVNQRFRKGNGRRCRRQEVRAGIHQGCRLESGDFSHCFAVGRGRSGTHTVSVRSWDVSPRCARPTIPSQRSARKIRTLSRIEQESSRVTGAGRVPIASSCELVLC